MANYPGSLDSLTNPGESSYTDDTGVFLDVVISTLNDIAEALEAKTGISESSAQDTPVANTGLFSDTNGKSKWRQVKSTDITPGTATLLKIAEVAGTGSSGVLEFTSIPATYRALMLHVIGRSSAALTQTNVLLTFEASPTAGAYDYQYTQGVGASAGAGENIGTNDYIYAGYMPAASSSANVHGMSIINILEYANTGLFKTVKCLNAGATNIASGALADFSSTGLWESTAAIDRIRLTLASGNWTTASRATLYGLPS